MKFRKLLAQFGLAAIVLATLNLQLATADAQGTAFTYQGRLDIAGTPANGSNDLTFTLYDAATAGATVGTSNTFNDLVVSNGLFTVTLDFGAGAFNGAARWLQIAARPGTSAGAYTNLAPRQAITPAPYAVFAGGVAASGLAGTLPASALSGAYSGALNLGNAANSFTGSGAGLTSLNAANLSSGTVADARLSANVALRTGGNTFSGTQVMTNGNVGIGITTPLAQLDVRGPSTVVGGIALGDYNITNSRYIGIIGVGQPANIAAGSGFSGVEFGGPSGNTNSGMLAFHTHNFGAGSAERMRITKAGNVGIGTTTPATSLDVNGIGTMTSLELRAVGSTPHLDFSGANVDFNARIIYTGTNDNGLSYTAGKHLFSGGKVGIGTTTPNFPLSFPDSAGEKISLYGQDITSLHGIGIGGARMEFYVPTTGHAFVFGVGNNTNFSEKMRLAGNGNIYVGNGAAFYSAGRLHIQSQANEPLYLNPFAAGGDVIIGGGGAAPNLLVLGEVTCVAVNLTSDRNAKEQFKPVNAREVLDKVARLPISEWQYKGREQQSSDGARHIGPMAQDFREAFALGHDDKHITSVDADGVALAAIQGLKQEADQKDERIQQLEKSMAELRELVTQLVRQQNGGAK